MLGRWLSVSLFVLLCSVLVVGFVPLGSCWSSVTIYSNVVGAGNSALTAVHPSGSGSVSGYGCNFTASGSGYLVSVSFKLWEFPDGDVNATCAVASGADFGSVIEASSDFVVDFNHGFGESVTFNFTGSHLLVSGSQYFAYVFVSSRTSGTLLVDHDTGNNGWKYYSGSWQTGAAGEGIPVLSVVGSDTPWGTSPPTTTLPYGSGDTDELIANIMNVLLYLVILLIPAFLLGKVAGLGAFGYIFGVVIGAALGTLFINGFPTWLLFSAVVGLVVYVWKGR